MSEVISSFRSLRAGSQVFTLLMFLCDFAYYVVCHQYDVCKHLCWQCVCWWVGGLSECGLCVFRELCPVGFLVVGEVRRFCCSHVVC